MSGDHCSCDNGEGSQLPTFRRKCTVSLACHVHHEFLQLVSCFSFSFTISPDKGALGIYFIVVEQI